MYSNMLINILPHEKHLVSNSADALLLYYSELMSTTVDYTRFKYEDSDIAFIGVLGFDKNKGRFVVLKRNQPWDTNFSDKKLSKREAEVLKWVAYGLTNFQIARRLVISENTVKVHLRNIYRKLNVESRVQASRFAFQRGLL